MRSNSLIFKSKNLWYYCYIKLSRKRLCWFDSKRYIKLNRDVKKAGIDPLWHYLNFGGFEGRRPCAGFDSVFYLEKYEDVLASGMNPLVHYLFYGKKEGRRIQRNPEEEAAFQLRKSYPKWIKAFDSFSAEVLNECKDRINSFSIKPLISILMPVYDPEVRFLTEAIESVIHQVYPYWELCIADDCSSNPEIRKILSKYKESDKRIKIAFRESNGHISAASNSALDMATGEFIALVDHDDLIPAHTLFRVVEAINKFPGAKLIYSDEDKVDELGNRSDPYFKSDWNPPLFYSQNMISHIGIYQSKLVREIGGFRVGYEGSQDYDLALRAIERISRSEIIHIPEVLYHWRMHENSTSCLQESKNYAYVSGENAINGHFNRTGIKAVATCFQPGLYRVKYQNPDPAPLVSLIIPTYNQCELLRNCIESIVSKTTYPNFDILVIDNNSDDEETLNYLESIHSIRNISCTRDERPFNFSAICNRAANIVKGDYIGLINNDIEVIHGDWLEELVSLAAQPDTGAVGAKLLFPDNTIQHAGVITGIGGVASHAHYHQPSHTSGYFGRAMLPQEMSAVTGACLIMKKSVYIEIGGMDEANLSISFNDVDLCLRLREAGYHNIWTPYATLFHHESVSRGTEDEGKNALRFEKETCYMLNKWGKTLQYDPAYNPNLTLEKEDFSLAWPPRAKLY